MKLRGIRGSQRREAALVEILTPTLGLPFGTVRGASAVGISASSQGPACQLPGPCDICSSSQELGHKLPSSPAPVQCGLAATRKCTLRLSGVFGAWENVILFEQFAGSFATLPPELGTK